MLLLVDQAIPEKTAKAATMAETQQLLECAATTYRETTLENLTLTPEGSVAFDRQEMPMTQNFLEALAWAIGMPRSYVEKISYALFIQNFMERRRVCTRTLTICIVDGVAENLAPAMYRPARTRDVLSLPVIANSGWEFRAARVSRSGAEIDFVRPNVTTEPRVGDVVQSGVRIINSETGERGLKASLFALRLMCMNGAVMADELGVARWNYDRRVAYTTSVEKFGSDLGLLNERVPKQLALYSRVQDVTMLDADLLKLMRRVQLVLGVGVSEAEALLEITTETRDEIKFRLRSRPSDSPAVPTAVGVWELHNRITAIAQESSFRQRSRLEEIGGRMLLEALRTTRLKPVSSKHGAHTVEEEP